MAEYDDRGENYGGDNYSDPNEYQDFQWDRYDDDNIDDLLKNYNDEINRLNEDLSKRRKDHTKAAVQNEIDKLMRRKKFLENLQAYSKKWNPRPDQITKLKTQIGILEKELRDTNSSLARCQKEESKQERRNKIDRISKTLTLYKKSFSLIKKPSGGQKKSSFVRGFFEPSEKKIRRHTTKPRPTEENIPLPKEEDNNWSAGGEVWNVSKTLGKGLGWGLGKGLGLGWWGTKGAVRGVGLASVAAGNAAIEGGSSLYSTFRENINSRENVSQQHEEIDRETEQKNENVVRNVEKVIPTTEEFFDASQGEITATSEEIKTQVINFGIEKNNLEGEKRKEEITRQENEKICQEEEKRRETEEIKRNDEEERRKQENLKRQKYFENLSKKLKNLGEGLSENETIRIEEEDIRQENENIRQLNENERQMKEDTRQTFENLRQADEKIRQTLDNNRKIYWEKMLDQKEEWLKKITHNNDVFQKLMDALVADDKRRQNLDATINSNEDKRIGNETIRLENEGDRRDAEEKRIKNENIRIENEKARIAAEEKRVTGENRREENEQNRIDEEEKRFTNEDERITNEKARISREKIAIAAEKERIDNEKRRQHFYTTKLEKIPESEAARKEAEKGRKEREQIIQDNEKQRVINEKERLKNEERRVFIQEQNLKLLEDRKNKIDEIEMKFSKKHRIEEKQPKKTFETYFTNRENSTEWIEDEKMKKRVEDILNNIDKEEEEKPQTYSNALLDGIDQMKDVNLTADWEKRIILEEKEKLKWRQKINALNEALLEKNIVLTDNDPNIKEFYDKNLQHSETTKNELNGFFYDGIKVIKRTSQKTFILSTTKSVQEKVNEFLTEIRKVDGNAETIISNEVGIFADSEINRNIAKSYIEELREEQKEMIRNGTEENGEFFEMEDFNEINREIDNIRKNKKFKIRPKVWARSAGGFISRMVKYLKIIFKRHFKLLIGLFLTGVGAASTSLILENFLRKAGYKIGEIEKNIPKKIKEIFTKTFPEILKKYLGSYYGPIIAAIFAWLAYIFRGVIFGFSKSVVTLSADIFGMMGKLSYAVMTGLGIFSYYPIAKLLDYGSYQAYKWWERSYLMNDEIPPKEILERRAEDENMELEEYKRKFATMENFYKNRLAKILSYPVSMASGAAAKATDGGKEALDWVAQWGIAAGVIFGIIILMMILNKWR